ncbi:MAG TPA: Holliday junction branch migration protein RuvA [Oligoflexia bacterium]|nr:Holliday junction branch migration protein RuvA [Oligoflexia bacterium]HMR25488.1 Holliday junction branch migration protein RuvA [Oligoflexia bacterium]
MIGLLNGTILSVDDATVTVDCQGVGYEVYISPKLQQSLSHLIGHKNTFFIYTHVREDQISLFGFAEKKEKALFLKLLSVSGVGAKTALNMLATLSYDSLINAIIHKDVKTIASCPGIGKKSAQRIAVELNDRLGNLILENKGMHAASFDHQTISAEPSEEIISALSNLGYKREHIINALGSIKQEQPLSFERTFKECLKILSQ